MLEDTARVTVVQLLREPLETFGMNVVAIEALLGLLLRKLAPCTAVGRRHSGSRYFFVFP